MLPKKNRVDRKSINLLFTKGRSLGSPLFTFKFLLTGTKQAPRIAFTAPKSVAKIAVRRNLLRRLGYRAVENHLSHLPVGLMGVFLFRKYEDDVTKLTRDIENILHKVH